MTSPLNLPTAESINWYSQVGKLYALAKPELQDNTGCFTSTTTPKLVIQHSEQSRQLTLEQCSVNIYTINDTHFLVATLTESNGHAFDVSIALDAVLNSEHYPVTCDATLPLEIEIHVWNPTSLKLVSVSSFVCDAEFNQALNQAVINKAFDSFHYHNTVMQYNLSQVKHHNKEPLLTCETQLIKNAPMKNENSYLS